MDERRLIAHHDLAPPVAIADLGDCRLSFHEQQSTGDVWWIATGPLGTWAMPLIQRETFLQVLRNRPATQGSVSGRAREGHARWQRVRVSDDLTVALRARGDALDFAFLFADGAPFGGGAAGLPTTRRANPIQRFQLWRSGRRGGSVRAYARDVDEA